LQCFSVAFKLGHFDFRRFQRYSNSMTTPQWPSNRSVRNFFTDCILATMPLGSAAYEGGTHSERRGTHVVGGGCRHKLRALRGPGERYSDVILRLATDGEPR
jgi:hypothetical protein